MLVLTSLLLLFFLYDFQETSLKVVATDYTWCSVQGISCASCFSLSLFDSFFLRHTDPCCLAVYWHRYLYSS